MLSSLSAIVCHRYGYVHISHQLLAIHNSRYIRGAEDSSADGNWTEKIIGNVTADTDITFEFGVRHTAKRKSAKDKGKKTKLLRETSVLMNRL